MKKAHQVPPGPRHHLILGSLQKFQRDPIGLFMECSQQYGDVVRLRFGPKTYYFLSHPDHIQHVLLDNHRNYGKQTIGWKNMRILLGQGLLTSEGDFWLRQRRIAQPAFHRDRIASFAAIMTRATEAMLEKWDLHPRKGPLDIASEMMRLTLRIVGETLLGTDVSRESDVVGQALAVALKQVMDRTTSPYSYLPWIIPTPQNRRLRKAMQTLDHVILGLIEERRRKETDSGDLLSMLMHAQDEETGERMNDRQLRDEVMTIFLAGHETTANALTWTWYLLSKHPDAQRRLHEELKDSLGGRTPALADLPHLSYARMVLQESMRLYPPAWFTTRSVIKDDEVGGYLLRGTSTVMISPYVTHRHPNFWENPEGFDPERFDPKRPQSLPRFAYFPFSGGPRQCIGNEFAMMEAQLILATVVQRYRLDLVSGHCVEPDPLVTLRPKYGMAMTLHPQKMGES